MGLSFTIAAGPRQRIHSRVRLPWDSRPYFTFSDSRLPLFVASYDSQGYGGGIRPRLQTGKSLGFTNAVSYNCHTAGIEVTLSNSSYVLLCCHGNAFVHIHCRGNKCLFSRCLARMTSASVIISAFMQCLPSSCLANDHIPS
jgi:hypothetical protein